MKASVQAMAKPPSRVLEWPFALGAIFLTLLVLAAFPYYFQAMWPPDHNSYGLVSLIPISLTAFALWRSSQTTLGGRVFYAPFACLGLLFAANCYQTYLLMYGDYPWMVGVPLLGGILAGAWFARQKWMIIAMLAFLGWWFSSAIKPAGTRVTESQSEQGVTAQVINISRDRCEFRVTQDSGYSPIYLRASANAGSIPIRISQVSSTHDQKDEYFGSIRAPRWVHNVDIDLDVPALPPASDASWRVNLTGKEPSATASNQVENLQLDSFKWADPSHRTLEFRVQAQDSSVRPNNSLYARDENGRLLTLGMFDVAFPNSGLLYVAKIHDIPASAKSVRIDRYSGDDWAQARKTFRFKNLPIAD